MRFLPIVICISLEKTITICLSNKRQELEDAITTLIGSTHDVKNRIAVCRLIEKIEKYPEYSMEIGIENTSILSENEELEGEMHDAKIGDTF